MAKGKPKPPTLNTYAEAVGHLVQDAAALDDLLEIFGRALSDPNASYDPTPTANPTNPVVSGLQGGDLRDVRNALNEYGIFLSNKETRNWKIQANVETIIAFLTELKERVEAINRSNTLYTNVKGSGTGGNPKT